MAHHTMVGDLSICKGYVYDKYEQDGESFVEIACWAETIEGYITQECRAVVKLPKRNKNHANAGTEQIQSVPSLLSFQEVEYNLVPP